ncbi:arsenic resistance protein [Paenibacillus sp. FSL W8-1187]|uniref:arsenic resistance protein n=1 Tax=Paenibacillus sp. FSL W8-1187 TaxID=2975339 RepID=UPI0030D8BAD3
MRITREGLERRQIAVYAAALLVGAAISLTAGEKAEPLGVAVSPVLALLLYGMFTQIPLLELRPGRAQGRFAGGLLLVNFVLVPLAVLTLAWLVPLDPAVRFGLCLVLLAPCIDYVVVFAQIGRGDGKLMLASTPLLMLAQLVALPLWLWLILGREAAALVEAGPIVQAFLLLVATPLALAALTQLAARRSRAGAKALDAAAWLPVPGMAAALLLIVASQAGTAVRHLDAIGPAIPAYAAFLLIGPALAWPIARLLRLGAEASRTLAFSAGTRNSLVVLPLALALPGEAGRLAAAAVVAQTMVELIGELVYIRVMPRLFRGGRRA